MTDEKIIPIAEAVFKVKIVKSPVMDKDFRWVAETSDNIGFSGYIPGFRRWGWNKTPEIAIETFKEWAALNGITKYEIEGKKYYDIVNEKTVQFKN